MIQFSNNQLSQWSNDVNINFNMPSPNNAGAFAAMSRLPQAPVPHFRHYHQVNTQQRQSEQQTFQQYFQQNGLANPNQAELDSGEPEPSYEREHLEGIVLCDKYQIQQLLSKGENYFYYKMVNISDVSTPLMVKIFLDQSLYEQELEIMALLNQKGVPKVVESGSLFRKKLEPLGAFRKPENLIKLMQFA